MPKSLGLLPFFLSCVAVQAADPAWNVRDATEKLLDKHALRMPVDDWFLQRTDGSLVQYFKPSIVYTGRGASWHAEVKTAKWRVRKDAAWGPWAIASKESGFFQMVVIDISTPSTGGAYAKVAAGHEKFTLFRAPGQSWVTQVR